MWDLPGPGIEPASPALQGRLLTTGPPGKPKNLFLNIENWYISATQRSDQKNIYKYGIVGQTVDLEALYTELVINLQDGVKSHRQQWKLKGNPSNATYTINEEYKLPKIITRQNLGEANYKLY